MIINILYSGFLSESGGNIRLPLALACPLGNFVLIAIVNQFKCLTVTLSCIIMMMCSPSVASDFTVIMTPEIVYKEILKWFYFQKYFFIVIIVI